MARDLDRPFPPSPRRLGLARRAGLTAASPLLAGAAACAAAALALGVLGRAIATRLGASVATAVERAGDADHSSATVSRDAFGASETPASLISPGSLATTVLELVVPLLGALAIAALAIHLAQTRALWLPRRRIEHAPALPADAAARTRRAGWEIANAIAIGGVVLGWLWLVAPRLAALPSVPLAAAALTLAALATLATAWVALGALDSLLRHAALARSLRMTAREKREDDRLAGADPRWRELRARLAREPRSMSALAGATLLVLGDDVAVAIAWDPIRQPVPSRLASGRGIEATQLLGLARRYKTPVHRDPALAASLLGSGPVDEAHWPRLAEIVAAVKH